MLDQLAAQFDTSETRLRTPFDISCHLCKRHHTKYMYASYLLRSIKAGTRAESEPVAACLTELDVNLFAAVGLSGALDLGGICILLMYIYTTNDGGYATMTKDLSPSF